MYKRIHNFNFGGYSFISPIEEIFNIYSDKLLNELTYNLFTDYLTNKGISKEYENIELGNFCLEGRRYDIGIDKLQALHLLAQILHLEMESCLIVPVDKKESRIKVEMSFEEFIQKKIGDNINLSEEFDVLVKTELNNIPSYFSLYKIRNYVLSNISERLYSNETLKKTVKEIYNEFQKNLEQIIIENNLKAIATHENIMNVVDRLMKDYVKQFVNQQAIGMTREEIGTNNTLLENEIFNGGIYKRIFKSSLRKIEQNFEKLIDEQYYKEFSLELIKEIEVEFSPLSKNKTSFFIKRFDDFKKILLAQIFSGIHIVELELEKAYQMYDITQIIASVTKVINEHLSTSNFEVAIKVSDLTIKKTLFQEKVSEDIDVISHDLFKSWQYEKYVKLNREPLIFDTNEYEKSNTIWCIVKNIRCGNKDTELAYELAKEKLEYYMMSYYFLTSDEKDYNFKIIDPYIIFNIDSLNMLVGRKKGLPSESKVFDETPKEISSFLLDFNNSKQEVILQIRRAIVIYYEIINSDDLIFKAQKLIDIWRILFKSDRDCDLSKYCSVVVAGTNYDDSNLTYKELRKILYDDFMEFLEIYRERNYMVLETIFERFKSFTKIIVKTFLLNCSSNIEANVDDILKWIFYINPNSEYILGGQE